MEREKVIKGLECLITNEVPCEGCPYYGSGYCLMNISKDAMELLKKQEAEIRQLKLELARDIAKGTWNGIKSGDGQFADMPTMQSAI